MSEQAKAFTKLDKYRYKYACIKSAVYMIFHAAFWRTLHFLKLARAYSVFACKHNFYAKIESTGVCHWCGKVH